MEYSIIAISVLLLVIFVTAFLSWKSKKNLETGKIVEKEVTKKPEVEKIVEKEVTETEKLEEKAEIVHETKVVVRNTEITFEDIMRSYFDEENQEKYFDVYQRLLKKISKMSENPDFDPDVIEGYRMLAEKFKDFCKTTEEKVSEKQLPEKEGGDAQKGYFEELRGMHESLMESVLNSAEKALGSRRLHRILKIDAGYVYDALVYFRQICPSEMKYQRAAHVLRQLYKK